MLKSPQRNIVLSVESVLNKLYISSEKLMISNSGHLYIPLIIISLELGIRIGYYKSHGVGIRVI